MVKPLPNIPDTPVSVKKHSFYVSLGQAAQWQKLQSGPRFGASKADLPTSFLLRSSFLFTDTGTEDGRAQAVANPGLQKRWPSLGGRFRNRQRWSEQRSPLQFTANLRTKILDFRGFDSSIILILRGGILRSLGNFPETVSQQILVGIILAGRLGVVAERAAKSALGRH